MNGVIENYSIQCGTVVAELMHISIRIDIFKPFTMVFDQLIEGSQL